MSIMTYDEFNRKLVGVLEFDSSKRAYIESIARNSVLNDRNLQEMDEDGNPTDIDAMLQART
jgi:hypothetical protein